MLSAKNFKDRVAGYETVTKSRFFYPVLLAILTFVVFWQVIGYEFVLYDDDFTIYKNPYVQSVTVPNILHAWKNPYKDAYVPLIVTFLAFESLFARTTPPDSNMVEFNPAVFHATNLILHIVNAILVFSILRILIKDELACFLGALLFAIHPVQVESVAWATGVKDVFSGFFSLVAIWQYLLYAELSMISPEGKKTGRDRMRENETGKWKTLHYLAAVFSFILALLAKSTRVIVPVAAFLLDYFLLKRRFRDIVVSIIGFIAIALPITVLAISLMPPAADVTHGLSFIERLLVASDSLVFYLYKLFVPIPLGPDYGRTPQFVLSQHLIYFTWIIPAVLFVVICAIKKHRSWLLASAGIFIAGVLPLLGFTQFKFQEMSTVADRYLYLSMVGPGMVLAYFLSLNRKRLVMVMCGVILCLLGILSMKQAQYWENTIALYNHALAVNPASSTFHANFGIVLAQQGKFDEAVLHFSEALKSNPKHMVAHSNLGYVLAQQGRVDEAIFHFHEALRLSPDDAGTHINLGNVLAQQGKYGEAVVHYSEALRVAPDDSGAHGNWGIVLAQQGKYGEAVYHFSEALKSDPHNAEAHLHLGFVLAQQGKADEANIHFSEALKINPGYRDLINAGSLKK